MVKNDYDIPVSKYSSATSLNSGSTSILSELKNIKIGTYRNLILECRALKEAGDKILYKRTKTQLPAVTFSGKFQGSHKKENLVAYSNFIIIDIDSIGREEIESLKATLFSDRYVSAIWISPSGVGLKVLINVCNRNDEHKICFDILSNYFLENYRVEVDKSGSDVCRLCFVSLDENILIKDIITPFDFKKYFIEETISEEKKKAKTIIPKEFISSQLQSEANIFKGTNNRNDPRNRQTMIKIIKFLSRNNKSITGNYHDWFRIACAIANTFTYDLGEKYYLELCRLDGELHDEYKSKHLLEYCYRNRKVGIVEFSTIVYLATKKQFKPIKYLQ